MSNTALVNNIYFTCENYNSGLANIPAEEDTNLLYPLIPNGETQNYQLAVAKCRVPLGTIPLTTQNLDLKKYELALRNGGNEASAYVKQINALTGNFYYVLDGNFIKRYSYTSTTTTLTKSINLTNICSFVLEFVVDDYENIYIAGSNTSADVANELIIINSSETPNILYQESFTNIKSIYIDRSSNFYLMDEDEVAVGVLCFNNQIGLNSVDLTLNFTILKDFAGANLVNGIFVTATENNIIIAHDLNILSYYTSTGVPITDYAVTGADQLVAGNVLASEDILMTADIDQLSDLLIATKNQVPYNIESAPNTPLTTGQIASQLAIASGVAYVVGTNENLYSVPWPITSPPANYTELNTTTSLKAICARNNALSGISTTDDLYFYNLNTPFGATASNEWGLTSVNFKPSVHGIISYDWNVSNNKMVVVDNTNEMYISTKGIYPLGYFGLNYELAGANIVNTIGLENYAQNNYVFNSDIINTAEVNVLQSFATKNGVVFAVKGVAGSQKVYELNIQTFQETGTVFDATECGGTIRYITVVDNNIVCIGLNYNIAIYRIVDQTLVNNNIQYLNNVSLKVVGFQDGSRLGIVHSGTLTVWNYITSVISGSFALLSADITGLAFNPNDITNGIGKLFYSYIAGISQYPLQYVTFTAGYLQNTTGVIDTQLQSISNLSCNVDNGLLFAYIFQDNTINVYYQSNSYNTSQIQQIYNVPQYDFFYFPQSLTGVYAFDSITTNITPEAIAISRDDTNKIYAINSANSLLYVGVLSGTTITFSQMTQFPQTYSYISTVKNTSTNITSTLRTFTISNQTPIANVAIANNKIEAIAKNESSAQFLVGLYSTNQIKAYNSSLVVQFTLSQNDPFSLFAKPADDINVPNVSIFNLQVVVDSINAAFLEAWNKLKALGGTLAEAPFLTLDYTGFLTINYSADYTQTGNAILFNNPLINLCYFQNVPDSLDVGFYRLVLRPTSTSTTQLAKSMYQFNQLDKILIQSTSLFVAGSWYGNNSISQVLTDIDVPIDGSSFAIGNVGQVLYFQPAMLRVFQMASGGNAINRIQMSILYRYRNGTQYVLELAPGEAFSVKLEFIKKF
jgi:hypothetical protein